MSRQENKYCKWLYSEYVSKYFTVLDNALSNQFFVVVYSLGAIRFLADAVFPRDTRLF